MSGGEKRTYETRGNTLFEKLANTTHFQNIVEEIRRGSKIDPIGYTDIEEVYKWLNWANKSGQYEKFVQTIPNALNQVELPANQWFHKKMFEYLLCNCKFSIVVSDMPNAPFVQIIDYKPPKRMKNVTHTDIRIFEGADQKDINAFIEKYWKYIKPPQRFGIAKKIASTRKPDLDKKINEYWEKPNQKKKGQRQYKEQYVVGIVNAELGTSLQSDSIKRRRSRKRNAKR